MRHLHAIKSSIQDRNARLVALSVALVVGLCLNAINQGIPLLLGEPMTFGRWVSAIITPIVPFLRQLSRAGNEEKRISLRRISLTCRDAQRPGFAAIHNARTLPRASPRRGA